MLVVFAVPELAPYGCDFSPRINIESCDSDVSGGNPAPFRGQIMENNLGLRTLPKTPHMNFNGKRTSAANILATHPETNPPTPVGVQTHMGLLFSPIFPPLPELAHTTRRASEGDPGFSRSGSRNMTLRSSLRKPIIKKVREGFAPHLF